MNPLKLNAAFGNVIAKIRKERGWTQEFLSFECQLTRNYISLLERGSRSPTLNTISRLASALKISEVQIISMTLEELNKDK